MINGFPREKKKYSNDEAERIILTATMLTNKHVTLLTQGYNIKNVLSVLVAKIVTR